MWNKIGVDEKGNLTNYPQRCELEDVVFVDNYGYIHDEGYFDEDSMEFKAGDGIIESFTLDEVISWCYKADLIQSIEESDSVTPSCTDYIDIPKSINSEEAFIAWMTT